MTPQQNHILLKVYNDESITDEERLILQKWSDEFWRKNKKQEHQIEHFNGLNNYSKLDIEFDANYYL